MRPTWGTEGIAPPEAAHEVLPTVVLRMGFRLVAPGGVFLFGAQYRDMLQTERHRTRQSTPSPISSHPRYLWAPESLSAVAPWEQRNLTRYS